MGDISNRYAIVGIGESERSRKSGTTPLHMALVAARNALQDAGLEAKEIDGVMSYSTGDSCSSHQLATYLGIRPSYVNDVMGGGSSTEMLIADAVGIPVVASGGAGKPEHLADAFNIAHADAAIVAGMVHTGEYTIKSIKDRLHELNVPVRMCYE